MWWWQWLLLLPLLCPKAAVSLGGMLGCWWGWSWDHVLGRGGRLELQSPRGRSPV